MTLSAPTVFDFESTLALVRKILPFNALNEAYLDRLLSRSTISVFCQDETICCEDISGESQLTYLLQGRLRITDTEHIQQDIVAGEPNLSSPLLPLDVTACQLVAQTDCALFTVQREMADELLMWNQLSDCLHVEFASHHKLVHDLHWKLSVLKSSLFLKASPLHVNTIIESAVPRWVTEGVDIVREGEMGEACYFIKQGRAEVYIGHGSSRVTLAQLGPGQCFGEDALLTNRPRNASVKMITDGELMVVSADVLHQAQTCPEVPMISTMREFDLLKRKGAVVVDVRTEDEYQSAHLPMAINAPLGLLFLKAKMLDRTATYVCYCTTGRRARVAAYLLSTWGFEAVAIWPEDGCDIFEGTWRERRNYVLKNGEPIQGRQLESNE